MAAAIKMVRKNLHKNTRKYLGFLESEASTQKNQNLPKNEKSKTSLSIFIKCIEVDHLRLSISIFNKEIDDYIPIESVSKNKEIFAVYLSDVVKVEWVCKPGTTLFESRMGKLNNIGVHNFVCLEKISLNFEMHISNTITHKKNTQQQT